MPLQPNLQSSRGFMHAATTKGVVDRLRSKGFVQSSASKTDLRRLEISLTATGHDFAVHAIKTATKISARTTANLSPRETERLLALLEKL
jgi:DNA-binding MarR family transcriptional regulator